MGGWQLGFAGEEEGAKAALLPKPQLCSPNPTASSETEQPSVSRTPPHPPPLPVLSGEEGGAGCVNGLGGMDFGGVEEGGNDSLEERQESACEAPSGLKVKEYNQGFGVPCVGFVVQDLGFEPHLKPLKVGATSFLQRMGRIASFKLDRNREQRMFWCAMCGRCSAGFWVSVLRTASFLSLISS